jgi:phosphomannomutase
MSPWLLLAERLCQSGQPLSSLIDARIEAFPASGEINRTIDDPPGVIAAIEAAYAPGAVSVRHVDGLSVEFADWRFNLRMSNTEPVVRLNVESRGDRALMEEKTAELLAEMDRLNKA